MEATAQNTADQGNSRWEKIRFTGEGGEYFKIWIVNIFLSIVTLGIYSAWAKVRTKRYFYGNTYLDNAAFEYHATPMMILKGRIIAVAFLLLVLFLGRLHPLAEIASFIVIGLLAPFVIWRSMVFTARMSSYRNVRFGFVRGVGPLYRYLLLVPLMPILIGIGVAVMMYANGAIDFDMVEIDADGQSTPKGSSAIGAILGLSLLFVYLLAPYIQKAVTAYYLSGHLYGQGKFRARLSAGKYYLIYLIVFGLGLLVYLLLAAIAAGIYFLFFDQLSGWFSASRSGGASPTFGIGSVSIVQVLIIILVMFLVSIGIWFKSYIVSRIRNYSLSQLRLESAITFRSRIKVNRLFWIQFTNVLLLIFTVGLAYPWTIVRVTRYKLQTLYAHLHGDLDEYVTQMRGRQSALGEEVGEAFDMDLDLGI